MEIQEPITNNTLMWSPNVWLFCLAMASSHPVDMNTGILEGRVTIGPLRPGPVRVDEPEESVPAKIFASHKIVVLKQAGVPPIQEVAIDSKGNFKTRLPAGSYLIDFTPHDIGFPEGNPPQPVTIQTGQTTRVTIDIDTGMR